MRALTVTTLSLELGGQVGSSNSFTVQDVTINIATTFAKYIANLLMNTYSAAYSNSWYTSDKSSHSAEVRILIDTAADVKVICIK